MKLTLLLSLLFLNITIISAESFINFIQEYVEESDRELFSNYYQSLVRKLKKESRSMRKTRVKKLQTKGQIALDVKNPPLARTIKYDSQHTKPLHKEHRTFLLRYGAYEDFCNNKVDQRKTIWNKMKSCFSDITGSVAYWFNSLKRTIVS